MRYQDYYACLSSVKDRNVNTDWYNTTGQSIQGYLVSMPALVGISGTQDINILDNDVSTVVSSRSS